MNVFEEAAIEYDEWFETHEWVYKSEVEAIKNLIPETGEGIEIELEQAVSPSPLE